jgi:hypothetical protein
MRRSRRRAVAHLSLVQGDAPPAHRPVQSACKAHPGPPIQVSAIMRSWAPAYRRYHALKRTHVASGEWG